jgi:hypothetical protein
MINAQKTPTLFLWNFVTSRLTFVLVISPKNKGSRFTAPQTDDKALAKRACPIVSNSYKPSD